MNLRILSIIISRVFDYYLWSIITLIAALFKTGLTADQIKILFPVTFIITIATPLLIYFLLIKIGKISDLDITRRQERYVLFGSGTVLILLSSIISYFVANHLFFSLQLLSFLMGLTIFFITFFFKISGHVMLNVGFIFALNFLFDWQLFWLFTIVPFVAFARIYLKKHTLLEVLAGAFLGIVEPLFLLKLFRIL